MFSIHHQHFKASYICVSQVQVTPTLFRFVKSNFHDTFKLVENSFGIYHWQFATIFNTFLAVISTFIVKRWICASKKNSISGQNILFGYSFWGEKTEIKYEKWVFTIKAWKLFCFPGCISEHVVHFQACPEMVIHRTAYSSSVHSVRQS